MPSLEGHHDFDEFIDLPNILPLEGEEEVKEGKGLKVLTPNKLWTRFSILLAQIKAGNNSYKLKMKSNKYCIFCISTIKSLKRFITI